VKRSEVNKDPEVARKRAVSDLRCAAKKLGLLKAIYVLADLADEQKCTLLASNLRRAEQQTHGSVLGHYQTDLGEVTVEMRRNPNFIDHGGE
jgi:hypothetical protein